MSRFSQAEAEKLGWVFYHDSDEVVLRDGNNELGASKVVPKSIRAEKYIDLPGKEATRTTEEAPTIGLLLERIHLVEQEWAARLPESEPDARVPDPVQAGPDLEDLTVPQLKELAAERGIEVKGKKAKIISAIKAVL